ncbi:MAG: GDP-fucose synthetase [Candidatus Magasanikbacteria bacterium CG_4_9_14_0_2_um_filter_42_11]|uniref:GDP-L-fucose synthase n=1 Tax=Candidatus Magasanikbacteria bacterium CG_4_9_14_0_2_um_filter_42_11 TaxID=1974643 RepID=A0A2M8F9D9_9BACT|nr:MAG: GDP-fucose synthetase [Candidatus Magasanikbacteria bacterium CG_4_10_14_0_8_um_filter_42_12]PJC52352.1 MAG: GDP-fucose synthetase [Candidatus Magasanikbacteria bacterium CG_4_9_14_0_2_um_filter_42_11]
MEKDAKIFVAGHRGMVGSAIVRALEKDGYTSIVTRSFSDLDLRDGNAVASFFEIEKPEYVFLAAAKVGGILANNTYPAEFIYENLQIQNNVIHQSYVHGVKKLLFLGSSCIYPKMAEQPIKEEYLLSGKLEPTNQPYAIAKIAGIEMCQSYNRQYGTNFIAVMPTNLYGPGDNYHPEHSHVFASFVRKFSEAIAEGKEGLEVWGSGTPYREFLHVDDLAQACLFLMNTFTPTKEQNDNGDIFMNIGVGEDVTIKELVELFKEISGFTGEIVWDSTKPDGTPRKLLDVSRMATLGWKARIPLREGIRQVLEEYRTTVQK